MSKITTLKIDVTKIDKDRLYKGEKGTYLDAVVIWSDQPDKYGNDGMIAQQVTKEERENKVRGNILGNAQHIKQKESRPEPEHGPDNPDDGDSLPF